MAKGGRYLNTNKPEKKKGKGLKILVIVLLILALLIGGGVYVANHFLDSMLGNVKRAQFEEKNQDMSYEDLMAEIYGDMVQGGETNGQKEGLTETSDESTPEETSVSTTENIASAG